MVDRMQFQVPRVVLQGKRIFCIDDNSYNHRIVQISLERAGAEVAVSKSTIFDDVIHAILPVNLLLINLITTKGHSLEDILTRVRWFVYQDVPIVAFSDPIGVRDPSAVQRAGFSSYIAKPLHSGLFPKHVEAVLQGHVIWYRNLNATSIK
jgi:DNA-binding response OmpR family regulator